jgi:hypothetical protein
LRTIPRHYHDFSDYGGVVMRSQRQPFCARVPLISRAAATPASTCFSIASQMVCRQAISLARTEAALVELQRVRYPSLRTNMPRAPVCTPLAMQSRKTSQRYWGHGTLVCTHMLCGRGAIAHRWPYIASQPWALLHRHFRSHRS